MGWLSKILKVATHNPVKFALSPSTALGVNLKQLFIDPRKAAKEEAAAAEAQAQADRAAALEQEKKTAAETKAYQDALLEQAKNAAALQASNDAQVSPEVSNVIAGGTAAEAASTLKRKRSAVPTVASTLGINV